MAGGRILLDGFEPVIDASGNAIAGATLHVYLNGTTTLAPIFQDPELTIAATNPQTSTAAGYFRAQTTALYADAFQTYTIRLTYPNGTIVTRDNVSLIDPANVTTVSEFTSNLLPLNSAPAWRLALNVDAIDVRDYGPIGVSAAGDATALGAAIAAAASTGRVLIGPTQALVMPAAGLRVALPPGSRLRIRGLRLDVSGVTTAMTLATGWTGKIGLGLVAESSTGVNLWGASYPRATLTSAATRGDVTLAVSDLSLFAVGDEVLIHDDTRVYDADGSRTSEGATVIARSGASGSGTLTLGGSIIHSYTTSATVRRWVPVDVDMEDIEVIGAGAGADQDGIWLWGVRNAVLRDVSAVGTENRGFVVCNGRTLTASDIRGRQIARNGLGYLLAVSGTDRVTATNLDVSNGRHAFASGRAPGGSQMQSMIAVSNVTCDGMQDCAINAHPGVYQMVVANVVSRNAQNAGTNGDALIIFQGTHLEAVNCVSGLARRHGIIIESFGHLDPVGHTYRLRGCRTEAGVVATTQYGIVFSDATCTNANGFTGAASSPVDVIDIDSCDFRSRSGCLLSVAVSTVREVRITAGSMRSVGPAQHGHGFRTLVSGTGNVQRVVTAGTTFESNGGSGFAGAFFSGRSGAAVLAHAVGAASRGSNQWGFRIDEGTLTHSPLDAQGFTTSATVAGTGGTLVTY